MTKEEILEKSRKSGDGFPDEREQEITVKAGNLSGNASIVLAGLIMMVNAIADGPDVLNIAILAVVCCSNSILFGYQAFFLKKRAYWFLTVLDTTIALFCIYAFLRLTLGW